MKTILLILVYVLGQVFSLSVLNYMVRQGEPYEFATEEYSEKYNTIDTVNVYKFRAQYNGYLKVVCDHIKIITEKQKIKDCTRIYFSITEDDIEKKRICNENIEKFVYKSTQSQIMIKIVSTVDFKCTVFNNIEPKPTVINLHPNSGIQTIGSPPDPIAFYDHLWAFNSPKNTRISFQCVIGLSEEMPNCTKNVLTFNNGKNQTEYCGSEYVILFSTKNKGKVRLQLDEIGDGYFECLVQAVTGPSPNQYENAVSIEVDSSEHGVKLGKRATSCNCGYSNKKTTRILNGNEARPHEFPWIVSMNITNSDENSTWHSMCGASIITPRHLLTAGHCLINGEKREPLKPENIRITLGEHNLKVYSKNEQIVTAEKLFIENMYREKGLRYHDIGLIFIRERIQFTNLIGPVCLYPKELPIVNRRIILMGWGKTEENKTSEYLRKSKARVFDSSICGGNEWDLCTMTTEGSTCGGDSGGPLVWLDPDTNRYTQVSLVSRGHEDCISTASLSTRISYFYNWIQDIIKRTDPTAMTCSKL